MGSRGRKWIEPHRFLREGLLVKCLACGLFPFQPCCLASHSQHISGATILKVGQDESPRSSKTPEALSSLTVAFRIKQTAVHGLSSQHDLAPAHLFICHVATCSRPLVSVVPLNPKHLSSQECLCVLARFPSPTLKKESVLSSPGISAASVGLACGCRRYW